MSSRKVRVKKLTVKTTLPVLREDQIDATEYESLLTESQIATGVDQTEENVSPFPSISTPPQLLISRVTSRAVSLPYLCLAFCLPAYKSRWHIRSAAYMVASPILMYLALIFNHSSFFILFILILFFSVIIFFFSVIIFSSSLFPLPFFFFKRNVY